MLKESALHRLYEIVRARSIDALLAESKKPRRKSIVVPVARARDEVHDDAEDQARATAEEVELAPISPDRRAFEDQSSSCLLGCGEPLGGCVSAEV